MPNKFASGKHSIAECDRCGQRYKLHELRTQTLKTKPYKVKVCKTCWDPDHPQLKLGMYPIDDPQALRTPRPDINIVESRDIQWGWNPVGGARANDDGLTPNNLVAKGQVGTVTVSIS